MLLTAVFMLSALCVYGVHSYGQNRYRSDYEKLSGYYADIYYGEGCEAHAATTKRLVDTYYPYLAAEFGIAEGLRAEIIIHAGKEEMYGAMGKDYGEKPPMGAYYKGAIQILSPECWANSEGALSDQFLAEGPVVHELAHFMLDKITGGNYEIWFSEGIALYMEYKYMAYEWQAQLIEDNDVSYGEMAQFFSKAQQNIAYGMAFEKVNQLADNYGQGVFSDIYKELSKGRSFGEVIKAY